MTQGSCWTRISYQFDAGHLNLWLKSGLHSRPHLLSFSLILVGLVGPIGLHHVHATLVATRHACKWQNWMFFWHGFKILDKTRRWSIRRSRSRGRGEEYLDLVLIESIFIAWRYVFRFLHFLPGRVISQKKMISSTAFFAWQITVQIKLGRILKYIGADRIRYISLSFSFQGGRNEQWL